jgi:hypothetical protein
MPRTSGTRSVGNGAGKGPGIGGPAREPAPAFTADSPTRATVAHLENGDFEEQGYRGEQRRHRRELREKMLKVMEDIANDEKQPGMTRGTMADKILDRIDGKPVASVNLNANIRRSVQDLSDDELAALAGDGEGEDGTGGEEDREE